ncbi:hypothetical protein SAVCW2_71270 [Streptomyces avermitilis]|uniref:Uncharacterized protein n=1 Tax=Streptomyces avermitilis TaxID=33903 RepID=A0A4D4N3X5_STRAX|nr:hypothetical protein SAVMC3_12750 [Streptomyces avermitilis]GDY79241.1 hypothetical protein SAV31267_087260 [Streptomyces avermitilis]GDY87928.1 hypothetical protein SAVCW2_71270 [Streptomyces avermitilis]
MWNISAISAADSSLGSAKKLRENTSNARWCAASGKRIDRRKSWALTASRRVYTSGTLTSSRGSAATGFMRIRSRRPNVGLSATNPSALHGGVRGTRRKLSCSPALCRSG